MSIKKIRVKKEGPKPKRNTFESRYKRRSLIIDSKEELLDMCFNKPLKKRGDAQFI